MGSAKCLCIRSAAELTNGSAEIIKGVRDNKNLEVTDECLFLFGNGDGGGGPTPLMMEKVWLLAGSAY